VSSTTTESTDAFCRNLKQFTTEVTQETKYVDNLLKNLRKYYRGTWMLVHAFNKNLEYEQLCNQHSSQQRHLSSNNTRVAFVPPLDSIAEKTGYIVFKDSKVVIFYTNDLMENSPEPMLQGTDDRAVRCVGKISRWTGVENLHQTDFLVATPIVTYNMFMNSVDCTDQYHATLPTQHKEQHLYMTIFTFTLDLSIAQAYAIYQKKTDEKKDSKVSFFEFIRRICQFLICGSQGNKRHSPSNTLADEEINES
jgi:hypothetical protein